jgi:UbiA prenyltransferase family
VADSRREYAAERVAARHRATGTPRPLLVLETMRPRQWLKNTFVLAGVVFSGKVSTVSALADALVVTGAFCMASGAAYLFNDARDAATDRLNPRTAARPVARGDLSTRAAYAAAGAGMVAAVGAAFLVNWHTGLVTLGFLLLQGAYSVVLKHLLFLDVIAIASLFVLRAFAGVEAVDARISPWLLLCTGLLALFLGLAKRRGEAVSLGGAAHPQRPVLDYYSVGLLDELISVVTPSVVVVYALYTVSGARTDAMLLTLPFVIYGLFRVLFLMHHQSGHAQSTEEPDLLVWRDPPLLFCVVAWAVCSTVITLAA